MIWTFFLRKGVTFHDGTPFNAEAVLFSLNRQHDKTHPFNDVSGSYVYWVATGLSGIVDKITAVDEFTVQIRLKTAYAPFIYTIAITSFAIVSPTAVKKVVIIISTIQSARVLSNLSNGIRRIKSCLLPTMTIGVDVQIWIE